MRDSIELSERKRKLRKLRSLEIKLRFQGAPPPDATLVWDRFFDLRSQGEGKARYALEQLEALSRDAYRKMIDEYWSFVSYELLQQNDETGAAYYDTSTLVALGLPCDADAGMVKKRFRELAKRYHPDTGGDAQRFIALMEAYRKLLEK